MAASPTATTANKIISFNSQSTIEVVVNDLTTIRNTTKMSTSHVVEPPVNTRPLNLGAVGGGVALGVITLILMCIIMLVVVGLVRRQKQRGKENVGKGKLN